MSKSMTMLSFDEITVRSVNNNYIFMQYHDKTKDETKMQETKQMHE